MICLIECNGMTNAQQIKRLLGRYLIKAFTCRLPKVLAVGGCSYAVKVSEEELEKVLKIIRDSGFTYRRIYRVIENTYEEVIL